MIVYVWSRRNTQVMMNFLGIFNFRAPFMPFVLLAFSIFMTGKVPVADMIGIGAGHLYYYFVDVFPALYGWEPLKTPWILSKLVDPPAEILPIDQQHNNENNQDANDSAAAGVSPHSSNIHNLTSNDDASSDSDSTSDSTSDSESKEALLESHKKEM